MARSHASMRDDFEITAPAVDRLAALLQHCVVNEGGARMAGGGLGGRVVTLLPHERVPAARQAVADGYRSPDGQAATARVTEAADGAGRVA